MSVQNFSFLARLEVAEKFVVGRGGGVGWWWSRPSLGFSFIQAEQKHTNELTHRGKYRDNVQCPHPSNS